MDTEELTQNITSQSNQAFTGILNIVQETLLGPIENGERNPTMLNQIVLAMVLIIAFMLFVEFIRTIGGKIYNKYFSSPALIPEIVDAKKEILVTQDPNDPNSIYLRRSRNESEGIEFSYMFWIFIEDYEYKKGEMKNIFVKGSFDGSNGSICPGMFLHPTENKLIVMLNTYSHKFVREEISNIPIGKWFHVAAVMRDQNFDIYMNGLLKKRMSLPSLPKQNFGDLFICKNRGFSGFLSKMKYYDYAVNVAEIESHVAYGPSTSLPMNKLSIPPYLSTYFWLNSYR